MREERAAYRIIDIEEHERPRERMARLGPQALSNAELLAILLRTGMQGENAIEVAERLLQTYGGVSGLYRASLDELKKQKGLGLAKATQIKAAIELSHRMNFEDHKQPINSPQEAADIIQYEMACKEQEELWVLILDVRNRLISIDKTYKGSLNSSQVRVGELFKMAIRLNAASVIIAHNHPSGDPNPSPDDAAITRAIVQAGKMLDVDVLDHIVIGAGKFASMKERGLGF
jgi:DNA repair protein RadC